MASKYSYTLKNKDWTTTIDSMVEDFDPPSTVQNYIDDVNTKHWTYITAISQTIWWTALDGSANFGNYLVSGQTIDFYDVTPETEPETITGFYLDWTKYEFSWWWEESNTKTFYLSSTSDLTNAQAAYDWYKDGKNPIIVYSDRSYLLVERSSTSLYFVAPKMSKVSSLSTSLNGLYGFYVYASNGTVTSISIQTSYWDNFLATNVNYWTVYTPQYNWSPATKKYVDDKICLLSQSAYNALPSSKCTDWVYYVITDNECLWEYDDLVQSWMQCAVVELNKHPQKYYKKFLYECCLYEGPSWNLALYDECSWWQCCTLEVFQYCWYIND